MTTASVARRVTAEDHACLHEGLFSAVLQPGTTHFFSDRRAADFCVELAPPTAGLKRIANALELRESMVGLANTAISDLAKSA
jgi:hypothetical protein